MYTIAGAKKESLRGKEINEAEVKKYKYTENITDWYGDNNYEIFIIKKAPNLNKAFLKFITTISGLVECSIENIKIAAKNIININDVW